MTTVLILINNWALSEHSCSNWRSLSITDYRDGMCSGQHPQSRCLSHETVVLEKWTSSSSVTWLQQDPTFNHMTSPLGLLLLHDLLALLSPSLIDGVAWVIDLKGVLVLHVGILDFSALFIKLQNVAQPKSDGERRREFKEQQQKLPTKSSALYNFYLVVKVSFCF